MSKIIVEIARDPQEVRVLANPKNVRDGIGADSKVIGQLEVGDLFILYSYPYRDIDGVKWQYAQHTRFGAGWLATTGMHLEYLRELLPDLTTDQEAALISRLYAASESLKRSAALQLDAAEELDESVKWLKLSRSIVGVHHAATAVRSLQEVVEQIEKKVSPTMEEVAP